MPKQLLFSVLPEDLFRPLTSKYRHTYGDVLTRLGSALFTVESSDHPTRDEVIGEIDDVLSQSQRPLLSDDDDADEIKLTARDAYNELRSTGWLREVREGWTVFVEMDVRVSRLLEKLLTIDEADEQTFSGTVVSIVNDLESAVSAPEERGASVSMAASHARDFARHLRGVIGTIKTVEQDLLGAADFKTTVHRFFEDFAERIVLRDYGTITASRNNPYQFRHKALGLVSDIEGDATLLRRIATSYVSAQIAGSLEEAEAIVERHITSIRESFSPIDISASASTLLAIESNSVFSIRSATRISSKARL